MITQWHMTGTFRGDKLLAVSVLCKRRAEMARFDCILPRTDIDKVNRKRPFLAFLKQWPEWER